MYWLIVLLMRPYFLLILFAWLGFFYVRRKQREERRRLRFVAVPLLLLTVLSIPAVGYLAQGTLEWQYAPLTSAPADTDVIVVLAGSIMPPDESQEKALPGPDTLYRCLHAADLYHQKPVPILVSGGKVDPGSPGPTVAKAMADFLKRIGVREEDLIVEDQSSTTYENVVETSRLLRPRQARRIVLVTDARHMLRSERCFRKLGFDVTPSACSYAAPFPWDLGSFLPDPGAVLTCHQVFHEWLGMAWYWLHGRI